MNSSLGPKQVFLDRGPWRLDDGGHSHTNPIKPWQTKFSVKLNARSMKKDW